jgi:hypothetical protein
MSTTVKLSSSQIVQDDAWQALLTQIPVNLEKTAFSSCAYFRHRNFKSAEDLLRLILGYATGLSMPFVTAWAAETGLATLTPEALHTRIEAADHWLKTLTAAVLTAHAPTASAVPGALRRLRLLDGTQAPRPGATGTDWRVHLSLDLGTLTLDEISLTDHHTGESVQRFTLQAGDLVVGDSCYGTRTAVARVREVNAHLIVRVTPSNFPVQTRDGETIDLLAYAATVDQGAAREWAVQTAPTRTQAAMPGRLIIYHLSDTATNRATRRNERRRNRRGNGEAAPDTRLSWQYLILFTTVPAELLSTEAVLDIYRFRWQVELAIKRYKSIVGLSDIRTRTNACCRTVLWAKFLLILLTEYIAGLADDFSPSGARVAPQCVAPPPDGVGDPTTEHYPGDCAGRVAARSHDHEALLV